MIEARPEQGSAFAQPTVELPLLTPAATGTDSTMPADPPIATLEPAPPGDGGARPAERLYALDLIRFSAALMVVVYHIVADNGRRGAWGANVNDVFGAALYGVTKYGWIGVELFFVISGFAICMSCWGRSLSDFFSSRVTRLMPAYMFAVLLTGAVLMIGPVQQAPSVPQILVNLTMLQQFLDIPGIDDVYWTLFVELKFYILFAVVVWFGVTYRRVVLFNMIWTVLYLFAAFSKFQLLIVITEPRFAPYFVAGTTLYLIYRFGPNLLLWGMLAISMAISVWSLQKRVEPLTPVFGVSYPVSLGIMFALFGLMILLALGKLSWLRWPGLMTVGALTYPVYLLHRQLGWVAIVHLRDAAPVWLLAPAIVAGALALAWLTHRLVERPLARLLRRGLQTSFAQLRAAEPPERKH